MANVRVTDFTAATTVDPANDAVGMVDVSDTTQNASGTTKKVTPTLLVASVKLDDMAAPDDNTDLNASASAHGLLPKLSGTDTEFLNGTGQWTTPAGGGGGLDNVVEDTTPQLGGQLDVNGNALGDGTRELLAFVEDASAVNHVEIENEATGSGPIIRSTGDDTNVDLNLDCKGSGEVNVGANLDVTGNITVSGTVDGVDVAALSTSEATAIHDATAGEIAAITEKATPTSTDLLLIEDAADSNNKKKVQIGNLPGGGGGISNVVEDTTPQLGGMLDVNGQAIGDGTRELLTFTEDASAVNHVNVENQATGSGPIISAAGDDTNVALNLAGKGTGTVNATTGLAVTGNITVTGTVDGVDVAALSTSEAAAIHDNVSGEIAAITAKATPTSSDFLLIEDAAASNAKKRITIGDLPASGGSSPPFDDDGALVQDSTDTTKELRIDVGSIATGTTRVLTMPNQDIDLTPDTGSFQAPLPVSDATAIVKGSADTTRRVRLEADQITTGTTRVLTMPDQDVDLTPNATFASLPLPDNVAHIRGSADTTRQIRFEADQITTGTTRVVTMPDQDVNLTPNTGSFSSLPVPDTTAIAADVTGGTTISFNCGTMTSNRTATWPDADLTVVGTATTQTLTNKTLTTPVISTISNTGTLTLPTSTDTLVGRATTDTLTNKTLTTPTIASFANATHDHSNAAGGGVIEDLVWAIFFGGGPNILEFEEVTEPTTPSDGDAYFLAATPTGSNWSGEGGKIALYKGSTWYFRTPVNGTRLHVDTAATSHWGGADIIYSADETEWYPALEWWTTTAHFTGRYTVEGETIWAKCFQGDLEDKTGSTTAQNVAHGVTLSETAQFIKATGSIGSGSVRVYVPQNFAGTVFECRVTDAQISMYYNGTNLSAYDYEIRLEYVPG